jgi:conjugative transfer signal peptidase TraF
VTRRERLRRALAVSAATLALGGGLFGAVRAAGLWYNSTPSMPEGIYRLNRSAVAPLERGTIIAICPSPAVLAVAVPRRYLAPGPCPGNVVPLLKRVAAVGGDRVDVTERFVSVNGQKLPDSGRFERDAAGMPLPRIPAGRYSVAPNKVWLYGPNPRSWDSRYYGAQPVAGVLGTATPVLTLSR